MTDVPTQKVSMHSHPQSRREFLATQALGIGGVILFGLPENKDEMATGAYDDNGIVQRAIRALRKETPGLLIATDGR